MKCPNCGCENDNNNAKCEVCGKKLNSKLSTKQIKATEQEEKRLLKIYIFVVIIVLVILLAGTVYFVDKYSSDDKNSLSYLVKSDEELILGSWKMDTSKYGKGLELTSNLDGVITKITFYSDGTCVVEGIASDSENGTWSIVDGNLKVQGYAGGMFWHYKSFISSYSIEENELILYEDDKITISYIYYKN